MTAPAAGPKLAQAMAARIDTSEIKSGAEVLRQLRSVFPDSPLELRVAALNLLRHSEADRRVSR